MKTFKQFLREDWETHLNNIDRDAKRASENIKAGLTSFYIEDSDKISSEVRPLKSGSNSISKMIDVPGSRSDVLTRFDITDISGTGPGKIFSNKNPTGNFTPDAVLPSIKVTQQGSTIEQIKKFLNMDFSPRPNISNTIKHELAHNQQHLGQGRLDTMQSSNDERISAGTGKFETRHGYLSTQIEMDARSATLSSNNRNAYKRELSIILSNKPTITHQEAKNMTRSLLLQRSIDSEIGDYGSPDTLHSGASEASKKRWKAQQALAIQSAESELADNLDDPTLRAKFIKNNGKKFGEVAREALIRGGNTVNRVSNSIIDPIEAITTKVTKSLVKGAAAKPSAAIPVAGIAGDLVGEYVVKPAAEKLGVFDAVGRATHPPIAALEKAIPGSANVIDKGLDVVIKAADGTYMTQGLGAVMDAHGKAIKSGAIHRGSKL